ncbi:MAG: 3'-5' exonuclease [Bacteroidales bacterium]
MTWIIREDQLDPDQREFIDKKLYERGRIWIRGFAGSGKTILLVFTIREILRRKPDAKIAVVMFTHALLDLFRTGMRELQLPSSVVTTTMYDFVENDHREYDYVICDEVQDIPLKVIRKMMGKTSHLIVAGDVLQSIYDRDPRYREEIPSPSTLERALEGTLYELTIIHRLTANIIAAVKALLPGQRIWSSQRDMTRQNVDVLLIKSENLEEEVKYVYNKAVEASSVGNVTAILLPNHQLIGVFVSTLLEVMGKPQWNITTNNYGKPDYFQLNQHLSHNEINIEYVGNSYGSLEGASRRMDIILMTYHSAKGLDFDDVFLPLLSNYHTGSLKDVLFMVAMTRSRKNLYLSYAGRPIPQIDRISKYCKVIHAKEEYINDRNKNFFDF